MNICFPYRFLSALILLVLCTHQTPAFTTETDFNESINSDSTNQLVIENNAHISRSANDYRTPYEMNLGAVFSEDEQISLRLQDSVTSLISALLQGIISEDHFTKDDQSTHSFFYKALRNLGAATDQHQLAPLVLKSFSPDDGKTHLITIAFMKSMDQSNQIYRIIEFHAYPHDDKFLFKSPFEYNTRNLTTHQLGSVRYHLSKPLNISRAQEFVDFKDMFESLVDLPTTPLDYYCFETLDNLLRAHGIIYDCTKCNWLKEDLGFTDNNSRSFLTGKGDERYIFEYLVDFMADHCDDNADLYPPFVYGIATYFGDYGLSGDDMTTLKAQFRNKLIEDPNTNFLVEFQNGRKSSVNRHFSFYVISAFLCEEVVKKHGMQAMLKLAHSGRDGELFLNTLEMLLGVDKDGFHSLIERLITT